MTEKMSLIFVTGQSGSGLGTAIRTLEDLGFYCIDNLPFELIVPTLEALEKKEHHQNTPIVLGIHVHSVAHAHEFNDLHEDLKKRLKVEVLFLTAQNDVLQTRFNTTRRKHPFESEGKDIIFAINGEKSVLKIIEDRADLIIDTTYFTPQDLAWQLEDRFFPEKNPRRMVVTITSFGFKHGVCSPLDMLFDVRFLRNPFFVKELKEKNGLDPGVAQYILEDPDSKSFIDKLIDINNWLLPRYYREGKHYFRIGIGCTGGKHRSVCIAEILRTELSKSYPGIVEVNVYHRDILH